MRDYIDSILEQWANERPDLDCSPMGVIARIWRLEQLTEGAAEEVFALHGLTRGGFDVLAALRRSGDPYELSPTELYFTLLISSGGITNRIDRLEEMGLVERVAHPSDRRAVYVRLTPRGHKVIDEALSVHVSNEDRLLGALSLGERARLSKLLRKFLYSLEGSAPQKSVDASDVRQTMGELRTG